MSTLPIEFVKPKTPVEAAVIDKIVLVCSALNNICPSVVPFDLHLCLQLIYCQFLIIRSTYMYMHMKTCNMFICLFFYCMKTQAWSYSLDIERLKH